MYKPDQLLMVNGTYLAIKRGTKIGLLDEEKTDVGG